MLALWQEVAWRSDLGIDDDYSAAGGTSLLAARLFSLVSQRFGVRLPLTTILDHSTVRKLTKWSNPTARRQDHLSSCGLLAQSISSLFMTAMARPFFTPMLRAVCRSSLRFSVSSRDSLAAFRWPCAH